MDIFNLFFAELFPLINYSSKLLSAFFERTGKVFSSVSFITNDIAMIDWDLDPNMAHGHRMISIHMFKVCQEASSKPFQNFHQKISVFCWMKNVVTAHKKCEKQVSRNFRSASSLLIFGKYLKVSYKIFYFSSFILVLDV